MTPRTVCIVVMNINNITFRECEDLKDVDAHLAWIESEAHLTAVTNWLLGLESNNEVSLIFRYFLFRSCLKVC